MRRPTLRKSKTVPIEKDEVDFRVTRFSCLETSALTALGKHCKETSWAVCVGSKKVDIEMHVDKLPVGSYEAAVLCDGQQVFPDEEHRVSRRVSNTSSLLRGSLQEDFHWRYPFRGTVKGLGKDKFFEIRPMHLAQEVWLPATLKEQMDDCTFRAMVFMDDGNGGTKEVYYPLVQKGNIRVQATKRLLEIPERALMLTVPASDPLHAILRVDEELITHFFARPTPPPAKLPLKGQESRITLSVKQDRSEVSSDAGYAKFQHFLSGEVRAVKNSAKKTEHVWWVEVGPFAQHKIELRKHEHQAKVFCLLVDDELLVESMAEDIESREDFWECHFRLAGEKTLNWDVFETDADGNALDSKGIVSQKSKYAHEFVVSFTISNSVNLSQAKLHVDNKDFAELPSARSAGHDQPLKCSPEALRGTYNLMTPYKVNESASDTFTQLRKALGGLFCSVGEFDMLGCCTRPPVDVGDMGNAPVQAPRAVSPPPPRASAPPGP